MDDLTTERYGPLRRVEVERFAPPRRPRLGDSTPEQIAERRRVLTNTLDEIPQDFRRGAA